MFGLSGLDCSVDVTEAHWSTVSYNSTPPPSTLARASHSAVLWEGSMIVYGGYRFPEGGGYYDEDDAESEGSGLGPEVEPVEDDVIRFSFDSGEWDVVNTTAAEFVEREEMEPEGSGQDNLTVLQLPRLPAARYGHSAVVYRVS